jgi:hypothetical protein
LKNFGTLYPLLSIIIDKYIFDKYQNFPKEAIKPDPSASSSSTASAGSASNVCQIQAVTSGSQPPPSAESAAAAFSNGTGNGNGNGSSLDAIALRLLAWARSLLSVSGISAQEQVRSEKRKLANHTQICKFTFPLSSDAMMPVMVFINRFFLYIFCTPTASLTNII